MAKSFIDVVQYSPRTRLVIPVPAYSRVRLFRHPFAWTPPPPAARPVGLTNQPRHPGEGKDPSPNRCGSPVRPGLATKGADLDATSTGPSRCFAPDAHPALLSSSLV